MTDLEISFASCHRICEASGSNFVRSFRFLGLQRRRAMTALYAFARLADDATDATEDEHSGDSQAIGWELAPWLQFVSQLNMPNPTGESSLSVPDGLLAIRPALADSVDRFQIPIEMLRELVLGMDMDRGNVAIPSWDALRHYAFRVASTVGICCAAIWSPSGPPPRGTREWQAAIDCGIAFQLTNILRDVCEDARRHRIYLPTEEMKRFGIAPSAWLDVVASGDTSGLDPLGDWRGFLGVQFQRARAHFDQAWGIAPMLSPDGLRMFSLMWNTYQSLFEQIEAHPESIFQKRIRVLPAARRRMAFNHLWTPRFHSMVRRHRKDTDAPSEAALFWNPDASVFPSPDSPIRAAHGSPEAAPCPRIAIVGGGLAGVQCALQLARHGCSVTLFEAKSRLGGRAGSFLDAASGNSVDYCQHVGMKCCHALRRWIRDTHQEDAWRTESELHFVSQSGAKMTVRGWPLPPPMHLAGLLLHWPDLQLADRLAIGRALLRLIRMRPDAAFESLPAIRWLQEQQQSQRAIECFWTTILVSALGERMDRVAMGPVRKVLVDGFAATPDAFHLLVPQSPLSELIDARSNAVLNQYGVSVVDASIISELRPTHDGRWTVHGDSNDSNPATNQPFDTVVVAVPWHRFSALWGEPAKSLAGFATALAPILQGADALEASPITGIHTWWDRPWLRTPHAILINRRCQWVFPGPDAPSEFASSPSTDPMSTYYQVVISASSDLPRGDSAAILQMVQQDLCEVFPEAREAKLLRGKVVTDPKSVFSVSPEHARSRPHASALAQHGIVLAGDWVQTDWPATMEGALRSGLMAAEIALARHGRRATLLTDRDR